MAIPRTWPLPTGPFMSRTARTSRSIYAPTIPSTSTLRTPANTTWSRALQPIPGTSGILTAIKPWRPWKRAQQLPAPAPAIPTMRPGTTSTITATGTTSPATARPGRLPAWDQLGPLRRRLLGLLSDRWIHLDFRIFLGLVALSLRRVELVRQLRVDVVPGQLRFRSYRRRLVSLCHRVASPAPLQA